MSYYKRIIQASIPKHPRSGDECEVTLEWDLTRLGEHGVDLLFKLEKMLLDLGIRMDTGMGGGVRDWEWDWSLHGPVKVIFRRWTEENPENRWKREQKDASESKAFLAKVEAAITKPTKAIRHNKFHTKHQKQEQQKINFPRAKEAKGKGDQVSFSNLTNTKKLIPLIEQELKGTDPFNFTNDTWSKFIKKIVPKLIVSLLLDMKIVPIKKRDSFIRYLMKRMRIL